MLKAAPLKAGDAVVGTLGEAERQEAAAQGVHVVDPAVDEAFAIANALPTVEGAIMLGIAHTAATLHGALVLVLGYGRIGSLLVHRLLAFGAHVIVCSREERELAWATAYGCHAVLLDALDGVLSLPSLVYNTIPGPVLDERRLTPLLGHAAVIELASAPGGCADDPRVIKAGGLPGKTAPKTAAEILCEAILRGLAKLPPM